MAQSVFRRLREALFILLPSEFETANEAHSPEGISEVDAHAEVTPGLLHAVHTDSQLPRVAPACRKGKDGKELRERNDNQMPATKIGAKN